MHRSSFFLLAVACVLLAVSAAPPLPSNAFEGTTKTTMHSLEELVRHLSRSKAFASLARLLKNIKLQVPPVGCETQGLNLTMDCTSAQTMFNNITTQCPVAYIANSFSDPASLNDTILQDYCSGSCYSQTNLALNQVVHSCWTNGAFDSNSVTSFQDALVAYKVSCIKDTDGSYCTPKWKLFANISAALANGSLSDSSLSQVCSSSCVKNQANTLSEFGQQQRIGSASFGKVLCSQIDGQWCALVYQQAEQDAAQQQQPNTTVPGTNVSLPIGNSSSSANSSLSRWCQPCYRRFVQGAYHSLALGQSSPFLAPFLADQFAPKVNAVSYQCAKDQDGQFCVDKVNNNQAAQNISECGDVFDNINGAAIAAPCSLACVNQLQAQINSLGCCAFTYFQQRLNSSLANGDNPNTPFAYQYIRNVCNISIPNSCSAQQLNFSVVLSNVQELWANNTDNSQNLQGAMRRDLAARFAVPLSQVAFSALAGFPAAAVPSTNSSDNGTLPVNGTIPALPVNNSTNNGTNDVVCVNGTRYVTKGIQAWGYIIPLAAQELDWLQSEFQNATAQNDLSLDETASIIPLEARIDPVSPLMVNQTASNVTIAQNPWGGQSGSAL